MDMNIRKNELRIYNLAQLNTKQISSLDKLPENLTIDQVGDPVLLVEKVPKG